jgi:hypothetical protein
MDDSAAAALREERLGWRFKAAPTQECGTALDKWTLVPVVDSADAPAPVVVDLIRTNF